MTCANKALESRSSPGTGTFPVLIPAPVQSSDFGILGFTKGIESLAHIVRL